MSSEYLQKFQFSFLKTAFIKNDKSNYNSSNRKKKYVVVNTQCQVQYEK